AESHRLERRAATKRSGSGSGRSANDSPCADGPDNAIRPGRIPQQAGVEGSVSMTVNASASSNRLTNLIMVALIAGIAVGYVCNVTAPTPEAAKNIASYFSILTD